MKFLIWPKDIQRILQIIMKNNCQIKKLGEVVQIQNGFAFKSSEYVDFGFFVMRITNVQDGIIELNDPKYIRESRKSFSGFILKENDILMSLTGNVGRVGIIKKEHLPAVLNQRVARLQVSDGNKLDRDFLFYFLRSPKFFDEVVSGGKGMAQQNVSTKDIGNLEILLPSIKTQKEIVAKLDEKLAKLREVKKLREESLVNTEKFLSQTLREVFEGREKRGWEEKRIEQISKVGTGGTPLKSNKKYYGGLIPWVTSRSTGNFFVSKADDYITDLAVKETNCKLNPVGTLLIAMYGQGKTRGQVSELMLEAATNQAIATVLVDNKEIMKGFVKYFFLFNYEKMRQMAEGGTQLNLNLNKIKKMIISVPTLLDQQKIITKLDELSEKIKSIRELQISQLDDLKYLEKSYLREAFNGELL